MSKRGLDVQVYAQRQGSAKWSNESQTYRRMDGDDGRLELAHNLTLDISDLPSR